MSLVFPGVTEIFANFLLFVRAFIKEDFPTFERPIKAYSGMVGFGHPSIVTALITNSAALIFITRNYCKTNIAFKMEIA